MIDGDIPRGPYLIAVKHQSMFETIEMLRIADGPIVVLKRELADLPLWGTIARRYGVIPVDREAGAKALRDMLTAARAAVASGRPVVIFPEGTRVPLGQAPPLRPALPASTGARPAGRADCPPQRQSGRRGSTSGRTVRYGSARHPAGLSARHEARAMRRSTP